MTLKDDIKATIHADLPNAIVHLEGEDGEHFSAIVISASFEGLPLVRQHQRVLRALKQDFSDRLHALQLKTFTPGEWEREKTKYRFLEE